MGHRPSCCQIGAILRETERTVLHVQWVREWRHNQEYRGGKHNKRNKNSNIYIYIYISHALRTGSECEEDALVLEEMKQVADEAGRAVHTVLTASSFKGNSRECSGSAWTWSSCPHTLRDRQHRCSLGYTQYMW